MRCVEHFRSALARFCERRVDNEQVKQKQANLPLSGPNQLNFLIVMLRKYDSIVPTPADIGLESWSPSPANGAGVDAKKNSPSRSRDAQSRGAPRTWGGVVVIRFSVS